MLSCRDVVTLATDYAEGRLSWGARIQMRMHLAMCALCRRYLRQLEVTKSLLGRLGQGAESQAVSPFLREAFRNRKAESLPAGPADSETHGRES
jgi:anti-sigma factor ChrR (cupin superfamily)